MRSLHALLAATLIVSLLLSACSEPVPSPSDTVRPVKAFTVTDPLAQHFREFPARLRAPEEADLSFRLSGELAELPVREGQLVQRGDLIAQLDDADNRLRLDDRQATYDLARAQLDRMRQLVDRQMVSRAEFEERQAQYNQAQAALNLAQQELAYTRLEAPFTGRVARIHADRFQVVQANQSIVTLYAGGTMDVVFHVPESVLSSLRSDLTSAEITPLVRIANMPGVEIEAAYKEHASQPDPQTLTYQVALSMPLPEGLLLLPGMSATVVTDMSKVSQRDALPMLIPIEAVFSPDHADTDTQQVWVLEESDEGPRISAREVRVGRLTHNGIEILAGLNGGERIVAAGGAELTDGQRVRIWERERGL
jgi:RND family efflux transporter MFP subunit